MHRQSLFAAGSGMNFISFLLQIELQRTGEVQLVFDQEDSVPLLFDVAFQNLFSG
jgi:hypothetical protein